MTKKKKIILIVAAISAIIVSFMGGQSFSKYVTQVRGEGQVEVAKWEFLVNGSGETIKTINLQSTCNNGTLVNNKIAPGTKGAFNIEIDATKAEVGINYDVKIVERTNKPSNLIFKYNGETYDSTQGLQGALVGTIYADSDSEDKKITLPIEWEWKYETGNTPEEIEMADQQDTTNGSICETYAFDIIVNGTQMMPIG